jgi:hypothetical protein
MQQLTHPFGGKLLPVVSKLMAGLLKVPALLQIQTSTLAGNIFHWDY